MSKSNFLGIAFTDNSRVVVFNKFDTDSANEKTGAMVQSWIMSTDTAPHVRVKTGKDENCGTCPLKSGNGCYVTVFQAPLAVWNAFHRGRYAIVGKDISENGAYQMLSNRKVRIGSYGNPSFVNNLVDWSRIANIAKSNTGYDHDWKTCDLQDSVMASVHSIAEKTEANERGYRTFRTIANVAEIDVDEILCPASEEAGRKTTCERCGLCNGARSKSRKNIAIVAHGARKAKAIAVNS